MAVAGEVSDVLVGRDGAGEPAAGLAAGVVDLGAHEQTDVVAGHAGIEQRLDGAVGLVVLSYALQSAFMGLQCAQAERPLRLALAVLGPLGHQRELAHPPLVQPLDPQPVGGEQVVQRRAADLRGDLRGVRGERIRPAPAPSRGGRGCGPAAR